MITKSYETFSSSKASDNAFLALDDVARITADLEATRIIGGLMTTLLLEAYPATGTIARHTSDVDTAISLELASKGTLHERLLEAGYEALNGNRYVQGDRVVDLLVPSDRELFKQSVHGGRAFDSAPGVGLALATRTRNDSKDLLDIYNLLLVADSYEPEEINGWRLEAEQLIGARADTRIALHTLVQRSDLRSLLSEIGVSTPDFIQLAREKVGLTHMTRL